MFVSYKWLNEYVDLRGVTPTDLAEKLTNAGIEIDGVYTRNLGVSNVVVGYVQECVQHPNADKLSLCQVNIGADEVTQIVCGASNIAQGQKVPVAKIGTVLPGNFKIKKTKLRGEESRGMICSAKELGLDEKYVSSENQGGIMVLPDECEIGTDAITYLDLDDHILELDLTPNRSDCLSMMGVAYEVGAILSREVHAPDIQLVENTDSIASKVCIEIEAKDLCPLYSVRHVSNITIGSSPQWLQNRLLSAGIRPINNVVDVTNFVMLEYGQPLHAFDASKVEQGLIRVRRARANETVLTLDKQERTLHEEMLVIADPEKVIGLAGVMGAFNSEVTTETKDIVLESAYFSGASVRSTSKELGLRSEASLRFEKGVDPEGIQAALNRAAALLSELAGGSVAQGIAEQKLQNFNREEISLNLINLNKVLGTNLQTEQVKNIFDRLAFDYENLGHAVRVEIPTRRPDIKIEEDLMEEVARLYGYNNIPTKLPEGITTPGARTRKQKLRRTLKHFMQGAGLQQVLTYSLTNESHARWGSLFNEQAEPIALSMPMSEDRSHLRTTLIPNLLDVTLYNKNRKSSDIHMFEIGHTFLTEEKELSVLPEEKEVIAGVVTGLWQQHPWQKSKIPVDFYVAKGIVEGLLAKLDIRGAQFKPVHLKDYHPGRTAVISINEQTLGFVGQIHPQVEKDLELDETYAFEISLEAILQHLPEEINYQTLPKYPGIHLDLAVVVAQEVSADQLLHTIEKAGGPMLKSVQLFDLYEGEHIANDKKSMAFSLLYQDPEKTLTDDEVSTIHEKVVQELENQWQAKRRK